MFDEPGEYADAFAAFLTGWIIASKVASWYRRRQQSRQQRRVYETLREVQERSGEDGGDD